jgi:hypothetical protein
LFARFVLQGNYLTVGFAAMRSECNISEPPQGEFLGIKPRCESRKSDSGCNEGLSQNFSFRESNVGVMGKSGILAVFPGAFHKTCPGFGKCSPAMGDKYYGG